MFNLENYQERMNKIKKTVFISFIISMVLALAMVVLLVCFNFMGVIHIQTLTGTKYADGFDYPGWQILYWGVGPMIIQGYQEYSFNIWLTLAFVLPFLALIICSILYFRWRKIKGTNTKKAILEFVMGGLVIVGSIMLFCCDKFAIANAKAVENSYTYYYSEYLIPALNGEVSYGITFYPTLILLVGLVTGIFKIFNGLLLIYQKKYAKAYKMKLKEGK